MKFIIEEKQQTLDITEPTIDQRTSIYGVICLR
jgi:hypothetical protein